MAALNGSFSWLNSVLMTGFGSNLDWEVLQARWVLGGMEAQEFVDLAIYALQQGLDGPALQQIAGLSSPTSRDLGNLPDRVFFDMGQQPIDKDGAVALQTLERDLVHNVFFPRLLV